MKLGTTILAIMLSASCAIAETWNTNWFPMWQHPSKTDEAESNIVAQVVKRQIACRGYNPHSVTYASTSWWRSRSANLAAIKDVIDELFYLGNSYQYFGKYSWVMADVISTNFLGSYLASNSVPVFSHETKAAALARWGLPTNYLEYTPWRDLSGVGGYTNDIAAVGHPHGLTNSYTANGGTNFPPGRTAWYTTDYGWDGLTVILPNFWVYIPAGIGNVDAYGNGAYVGWSDYNTNGYSATYLASEASYTNSAWPIFGMASVGQYTWMRRYSSPDRRSARMYNTGCEVDAVDYFSTNYVIGCHYYLKITNGLYAGDVLDTQSYGVDYGWPATNVIEWAGILKASNCTLRLMETNYPPPNWTDDPPSGEEYARGWRLSPSISAETVHQLILRYAF